MLDPYYIPEVGYWRKFYGRKALMSCPFPLHTTIDSCWFFLDIKSYFYHPVYFFSTFSLWNFAAGFELYSFAYLLPVLSATSVREQQPYSRWALYPAGAEDADWKLTLIQLHLQALCGVVFLSFLRFIKLPWHSLSDALRERISCFHSQPPLMVADDLLGCFFGLASSCRCRHCCTHHWQADFFSLYAFLSSSGNTFSNL